MNQRILRADYLFHGDGNFTKDGTIEVDEKGKIISINEHIHSDDSSIKRIEGGICPGFINTHCHLELSHLHQKVEMQQGLHNFIPSIQQQREVPLEQIEEAIGHWDQKMKEEGIAAVCDISNSDHTLSTKKISSIHYHSFIELFGLRPHLAEKIAEKGIDLRSTYHSQGLSASLCPHSPYSVSDELFELIHKHETNGPLSIHNQESPGEMDLFESDSGELKEMLLAFGNVAQDVEKESKSSLVHVLERMRNELPLLLVHNTFSQLADLQAGSELNENLYWCFCPQANWYIEGRLPQIPQFISSQVKCTIGTDSLASNHDLSIIEELKLIQEHYPEISTVQLIQWACANGAEFMKLDDFGKLEIGKRPGINWIKGLDSKGNLTADSKIEVIC